jgi:PrtD family type I secretion system ABC transporter
MYQTHTIGLPSIWAIAHVFILSIIINGLLLIPSFYMLQIYDRVLPAKNMDTLYYLTLFAFICLSFLGILDFGRSMYCQRIAVHLDREMGAPAFLAAMESATAGSGDISTLRDLSTVRQFVASKGLCNLMDLPFAPMFMVLLYFVHPLLSLLTIAGSVLLLLIVFANHIVTRRSGALSQESSVATNLLAQAFSRNSGTVRAMGMMSNVVEYWGAHFASVSLLSNSFGNTNSAFSSFSRALRIALQMAILGAGAVLVMRGEMTAGMIFASSIIAGRALQPIDQLVAGWRSIVDARRAWTRLGRDIPLSLSASAERFTLPNPVGIIELKDVIYKRPNPQNENDQILKNVSFDLKPGEIIAVLGPSGAGKSTLARLLAGVMEPSSGTISMDGAEYRTWQPEQLGRAIGYLSQEVDLLPGTIAQNIARFDPEASDAAVTAAALKAGAHQLIASQSEGYQTVIGPGRHVLSGGMKQRIALARAFYGAPKVLVLDEPNAHLDSSGEAALERALVEAKLSRTTVIIVTHRPAVIHRCDKAMVLRDGTIESYGTALDVLKKLSRGASVTQSSPSLGREQPPAHQSAAHGKRLNALRATKE